MIRSEANHRAMDLRQMERKKKCKFEAAYRSMQAQEPQQTARTASESGASNQAEKQTTTAVAGGTTRSRSGAELAWELEERRRRERMELLLHLLCWGPD